MGHSSELINIGNFMSYSLEPLFIENPPESVSDRVAELIRMAEKIGSNLHEDTKASLADLLRVVNCYYSNKIEGHNTSLRDIQRALEDDLDSDEKRRNLQIEARAHIRVQHTIDSLYRTGKLPDPVSTDFLLFLHKEFYQGASDEMLALEDGSGFVSGQIRSREVKVEHHFAPEAKTVPKLMEYFSNRYASKKLGLNKRVMSLAAAHHRMLYIHPFPDGNGRVARLMSHAMVMQSGLGASGLWSISRGFARGLENRDDYKSKLAWADHPRMNDTDGRGALSRSALIDFTEWFLDVCKDQMTFMSGILELETLKDRLRDYLSSIGQREEAFRILDRVILQGQMPRGEARYSTGLADRATRTILSDLVDAKLLQSRTPKGPVSFAIPVDALDSLFPRLVERSAT